MDFFNYGHSIVNLIDPKFAANAWADVDKKEISRDLSQGGETPWVPLSWPQTPNFTAFINEIDKNMWRCWERYGKKHITPKRGEQQLFLFRPLWKNIAPYYDVQEYVWVLVPLVTLNPQQNITLMESSHRSLKNGEDKPYNPTVQPGEAFMFHAGLRSSKPLEGGAVVFARVYDVTGL